MEADGSDDQAEAISPNAMCDESRESAAAGADASTAVEGGVVAASRSPQAASGRMENAAKKRNFIRLNSRNKVVYSGSGGASFNHAVPALVVFIIIDAFFLIAILLSENMQENIEIAF